MMFVSIIRTWNEPYKRFHFSQYLWQPQRSENNIDTDVGTLSENIRIDEYTDQKKKKKYQYNDFMYT